jgi:hypothetical protein
MTERAAKIDRNLKSTALAPPRGHSPTDPDDALAAPGYKHVPATRRAIRQRGIPS